jgi:hypothetical protein
MGKYRLFQLMLDVGVACVFITLIIFMFRISLFWGIVEICACIMVVLLHWFLKSVFRRFRG